MGSCLVCAAAEALAGRPWCSSLCRQLLRDEGRVRFPGVKDAAMWPAAVAWATAQRAAGITGGITARVSAKLAADPSHGRQVKPLRQAPPQTSVR